MGAVEGCRRRRRSVGGRRFDDSVPTGETHQRLSADNGDVRGATGAALDHHQRLIGRRGRRVAEFHCYGAVRGIACREPRSQEAARERERQRRLAEQQRERERERERLAQQQRQQERDRLFTQRLEELKRQAQEEQRQREARRSGSDAAPVLGLLKGMAGGAREMGRSGDPGLAVLQGLADGLEGSSGPDSAGDRGGGTVGSSCEQAQRRMKRELESRTRNLRAVKGICESARYYVRMLQDVRRGLANGRCPAHAVRAYDGPIAQATQTAPSQLQLIDRTSRSPARVAFVARPPW